MDEKEKIKNSLKLVAVYIIMITKVVTPFVFVLSLITGLGIVGFLKGMSSIYIIFFVIIGGFGATYVLAYFCNRKKNEVNQMDILEISQKLNMDQLLHQYY